MSTVRIAIIGGGVIGRRHAGAIAEAADVELVAIADPAPSGRALADDLGVPLYPDIETLIATDKPDGVIVSTPTRYHFPPTMTALEAGCHVLVEKPVMATLEEADQVLAAEAASKGKILVGHHRRHYSVLSRNAREILRSGQLGPIGNGVRPVVGPETRQLLRPRLAQGLGSRAGADQHDPRNGLPPLHLRRGGEHQRRGL